MSSPLMPKSTALWLIQNTKLSFKQIADFTGLHKLEVQNLSDMETQDLVAFDSIASGQLTKEEIERCEADSSAKITLQNISEVIIKKKKARYTPIAKRADRPNAILWLLKNYPEIPTVGIVKLIGSTQSMAKSIKEKTYRNIKNLTPQSPISLGLCTNQELKALVEKYRG